MTLNCTNLNDFDRVIDVRTPGEFAQGSVHGAVNIPLNQLASYIGGMDKDHKIGVYCRSGARSWHGVNAMQMAGLDATNMGGIMQYVGCIQ